MTEIVLWRCICDTVNQPDRDVCRQCGEPKDQAEIRAAKAKVAAYRAWCRNPRGLTNVPTKREFRLAEGR